MLKVSVCELHDFHTARESVCLERGSVTPSTMLVLSVFASLVRGIPETERWMHLGTNFTALPL